MNHYSKTPFNDIDLRALFSKAKTIAVVGLSPEPNRASYGVSKYLIRHGYEIFGVRPAGPSSILGRPVFASLKDIATPIHIIDVFRNSSAIPSLVGEIADWISTLPTENRPKILWLQEGVTIDGAVEKKANELGLTVIADRCILKEHARVM